MPIRRIFCLALIAAVSGAWLIAQQPEQTRRIPQFENDEVRAWKSIIMPNQPLTMHRHEHSRAVIALTDGTLDIVSDSGETETVHWEAGKAYWMTADPPGTLHADVNNSDAPIEVIVVELK